VEAIDSDLRRELTAEERESVPPFSYYNPDNVIVDYDDIIELKKGGEIRTLYSGEVGGSKVGGIKRLEVAKDSLIRIPLFDFPGMEVKIDGKVTPHINNDCRNEKFCQGLITFTVPKGEHNIEIRLRNTPVRSVGNILTLISFGVIIYLGLKLKHK
jgi:hypothetical protein